MRRLVIAVVCVMATACGSGTALPVANATPSQAAQVSPSPTPIALFSPPSASTASEARTAPQPLPPGVTCRLPYAELDESHGGFILYPGGQRVPDPAASIGSPTTNVGLSYVAAARKWVPVPHWWVAPSGRFYVYTDLQGSAIHGVSLVDGSTALVTQAGGLLLGATDDGVYFSNGNGAWYIAFGSAPKLVSPAGGWQRYAFGALWRVDSGSGAIQRLDLSTGAQATIDYGLSVSFIMGFTLAGDPIVDTGGELAIFGPHGKSEIWPGTNGLGGGSPFADQLGVWFTVGGGLVGAPGHGIYLWTPGAGPQLVSAPEAYPVGPCGA